MTSAHQPPTWAWKACCYSRGTVLTCRICTRHEESRNKTRKALQTEQHTDASRGLFCGQSRNTQTDMVSLPPRDERATRVHEGPQREEEGDLHGEPPQAGHQDPCCFGGQWVLALGPS